MRYKELVAHFDGVTEAAKALDLDKQVVHAWGVRGRIPSRWQMKAARLSNGLLKPDRKAIEEAQDFNFCAYGTR